MAHTIEGYYEGMKALPNKEIDLDTDVVKVALMESTWVKTLTDTDMADINAYELNVGAGGTGYTAGFAGSGRQTIGGASLAVVTGAFNGCKFDGNDVTFTTLGADLDDIHAAVIYHHLTNDAASKLLAVVTFSPVFDPSGGDLSIQWHSNGILRWTNA